MNIHDALEQAYKNGYEAGVKEFAEAVKMTACNIANKEGYVRQDRLAQAIKNLKSEMVGEKK